MGVGGSWLNTHNTTAISSKLTAKVATMGPDLSIVPKRHPLMHGIPLVPSIGAIYSDVTLQGWNRAIRKSKLINLSL